MTEDVKRTWAMLSGAALGHAANPEDLALKKELADAADAYSKARTAARGATGAKPAQAGVSGVVMPFGRSKGVAIEQATVNDLRWVASALAQSIDNPDKARWRDENQRVLDAIQRELDKRHPVGG
jgi:hypothetical protein